MRRQRELAPSTSLEDDLDDASRFTARYDAVIDWSDGRSTITEKLMVSSWALRCWRAGPLFRRRMLRSMAVVLAAAVASIGLVALVS